MQQILKLSCIFLVFVLPFPVYNGYPHVALHACSNDDGLPAILVCKEDPFACDSLFAARPCDSKFSLLASSSRLTPYRLWIFTTYKSIISHQPFQYGVCRLNISRGIVCRIASANKILTNCLVRALKS